MSGIRGSSSASRSKLTVWGDLVSVALSGVGIMSGDGFRSFGCFVSFFCVFVCHVVIQ